MKRTGINITVIWEGIVTPDAPQRLAAAFDMLLSPPPGKEKPPERDLDSKL